MDHPLGPHWPQAFPTVTPFTDKKLALLLLYPMAKGRAYRPVRASSQNLWCDFAVRPKVHSAAKAAQPVMTKSYCESLPYPVSQLKLLPHLLSWHLLHLDHQWSSSGLGDKRTRVLPFYLAEG